ncbi:hypothetical protein [Clostridium intestinale]|uniref:Chromosome partition protein Smc n=1 Tax=Clostridium intestinale URNW TaxID=1294142 RepID=U2Q440_9CLOT|nr:hypothetical protein [Clostridium intestinale]ERK30864.1 hypothetical protein CINTURNW_2082 [Clostridium intestinale URNW]
MAEIKATTFRLSEETIKSFRETAEIHGMTQEQCLANLLHVFELKEAKEVFKDRKKEIEIFEEYISRIQNLYLTSLEINLTEEERFKTEFNKDLEEKGNIIISLNKEVKSLKDKNEKLHEQVSELKESLNKKETSLKVYDEMQAQNKFLINKITKDNESLSFKIKELKEANLEAKEFENLSKNLQEKINSSNNTIIEKNLYINSIKSKLDFLQSSLNQAKDEITTIKATNKEEIAKMKDEFQREKKLTADELKESLEKYYELKISTELKLSLTEKNNEIEKLKSEIKILKEKNKEKTN